ncbi:hypothetical protein SteCoe_13322 [Stentor coeruleus]|uniref:Peptidase A1 domain-containing protein n=1 Tax=Stentor coeruleus TaxID=5963 RepID=A0A1R2C8M1_9CILI|nr:hypothetical protein SteCoe_13322 [Stentor coeruleus]
MIWALFFMIVSLTTSDSLENKKIPSVYLRPKPKARAGGADDVAAEVFSFTFTSSLKIGNKRDSYTLTIGVLMQDIWITELDCEKCKIVSQAYDKTVESSVDLKKQSVYINDYLDLDIAGNVYEDEVIIENDYMTRANLSVAYKFIDTRNLAIDGILGLGVDENSVVYRMYVDGVIDKPIYSVSYLNSPYLVLGTPNFLNLNLVVQSQHEISFAQTIKISYFSFADYTNYEPCDAEINSLSSYILGPFEAVFKVLVNEGCHYEEELLMCECKGVKYPSLNFTIQSQTFSMGSGEYLITLGDNCFVGLKNSKTWILGEPFLKSYFTEYNLDSKLIRMSKVSALEDDLPSPLETTEGWTVIFSLCIALIVIYILAFFIFAKYEDIKKKQVLIARDISLMKKKRRIL